MENYEGPYEVRIAHTNGQSLAFRDAYVVEGMTALAAIDADGDKVVFPLANVLYYELVAQKEDDE